MKKTFRLNVLSMFILCGLAVAQATKPAETPDLSEQSISKKLKQNYDNYIEILTKKIEATEVWSTYSCDIEERLEAIKTKGVSKSHGFEKLKVDSIMKLANSKDLVNEVARRIDDSSSNELTSSLVELETYDSFTPNSQNQAKYLAKQRAVEEKSFNEQFESKLAGFLVEVLRIFPDFSKEVQGKSKKEQVQAKEEEIQKLSVSIIRDIEESFKISD